MPVGFWATVPTGAMLGSGRSSPEDTPLPAGAAVVALEAAGETPAKPARPRVLGEFACQSELVCVSGWTGFPADGLEEGK